MTSKLTFFVGLGIAGAAGWLAHAAWATVAEEPFRGQPREADELIARLDQLDRQQRRQLEALSAMQRNLRGLVEQTQGTTVAARGAGPDHAPSANSEGADEDADEDSPPIPTIEQSRAASEAEAIVQGATLAGRWTDEDSHRLEEQLRLMAPEDADELRREVIVALNRGELEIAFSGRPAF